MMTRSQFLYSLAGFAFLSACKDDGEPGGPDAPDAGSSAQPDAPKPPVDAPVQQPMSDAPPEACGSTAATIGTNHGHALVVPIADVTAGVAKTYSIQGGSGHPHTVMITAAMFAMLQQNQTVSATSST